jgi:hypothetical protein
MIGALTGTNDAGLTAAFNMLWMGSKPGEPVFLLMRRVLEDFDRVGPAVSMLQSVPVNVNGTIVISDGCNLDASCLEWSGGRSIVRKTQNGLLVADNSRHAGPRSVPQDRTTLWRAAASRAPISVRDMVDIMRSPGVLMPINLYSSVIVPHNKELYLAAGSVPAASTCTFERIPLFAERLGPDSDATGREAEHLERGSASGSLR